MMTKKITFMIYTLQKPGGAEKTLVTLANQLALEKYTITIITIVGNQSFYKLDPSIQLIHLRIPPKTDPCLNLFYLFWQLYTIRRVLRKISPHIIIAFTRWVNLLTLLATIRISIPVVISERNDPYQEPLSFFWRRLEPILYPLAHKIVVITRKAQTYYQKFHSTVYVIPNPILRLPIQNDYQRHANTENPLILTIARMEKQKRLDILIQAFAELPIIYENWQLIIIGDGSLKTKLTQSIKIKGIDNRVYCLGINQDPLFWIQQSSIYVSSSDYEGFGVAITEAMASGLPVISTACNGPTSFIQNEENGLLVPVNDVTALRDALIRLMPDREFRERLGDAAIRITEQYPLEKIIRIWKKVIIN